LQGPKLASSFLSSLFVISITSWIPSRTAFLTTPSSLSGYLTGSARCRTLQFTLFDLFYFVSKFNFVFYCNVALLFPASIIPWLSSELLHLQQHCIVSAFHRITTLNLTLFSSHQPISWFYGWVGYLPWLLTWTLTNTEAPPSICHHPYYTYLCNIPLSTHITTLIWLLDLEDEGCTIHWNVYYGHDITTWKIWVSYLPHPGKTLKSYVPYWHC
jgi:hypothetical protein